MHFLVPSLADPASSAGAAVLWCCGAAMLRCCGAAKEGTQKCSYYIYYIVTALLGTFLSRSSWFCWCCGAACYGAAVLLRKVPKSAVTTYII